MTPEREALIRRLNAYRIDMGANEGLASALAEAISALRQEAWEPVRERWGSPCKAVAHSQDDNRYVCHECGDVTGLAECPKFPLAHPAPAADGRGELAAMYERIKALPSRLVPFGGQKHERYIDRDNVLACFENALRPAHPGAEKVNAAQGAELPAVDSASPNEIPSNRDALKSAETTSDESARPDSQNVSRIGDSAKQPPPAAAPLSEKAKYCSFCRVGTHNDAECWKWGGKFREATHAENLQVLLARLDEHLSPAEKRELEAAITALTAAPSEPEREWVSVPKEPTEEMVEAYLKAQREDCDRQDRIGATSIGALLPGGVHQAFKAGYRAMLAALQRGRNAT